MHTPKLSSRQSSGTRPLNGEADCDPVNWDTNLVNFISNCQHPGLVRRASSSASHAPDQYPHSVATPYRYKRQHRRNLSAATTVGCGQYAGTPTYVPKWSVNQYILHEPHTITTHLVPPFHQTIVPVQRSYFGHARHISDPTACYDHYRVQFVPPFPDVYVREYPFLPSQQFTWEHSSASPDKEETFFGSIDLNAQRSLYSHTKHETCFLDDKVGVVDKPDGLGEMQMFKKSVKDKHSLSESCLVQCMQPYASPCVILIGLFFSMFIQSLVVSGLLSSMLTTLERRFSLSTRQLGYIISCYQGSGAITTAAISFLDGRKHNRLRVVGLASLLMAVGFGLFALPHFLIDPYNPDQVILNLRNTRSFNLTGRSLSPQLLLRDVSLLKTGRNEPSLCLFAPDIVRSATNRSTMEQASSRTGKPGINQPPESLTMPESDPMLSVSLYIFCFAMVLVGIGASPLHVLAPTYLWDNLTDIQYPIYSAIFYCAGGLGPACGYLAGAGFLSIYIDSPLDPPRPDIDRGDPLWLGSWWLGMLICSVLALIIALPVITFPRRLASSESSVSGEKPSDTIAETIHAPLTSKFTGFDSEMENGFLKTATSLPNDPNQNRASLSPGKLLARKIPGGQMIAGIVRSVTDNRATSESVLPLSHLKDTAAHSLKKMVRAASFACSPTRLPSCAGQTHSTHRLVEHNSDSYFTGLRKKLNTLFRVLRRVIVNPIWLGITFATVIEQSIVSAFLSFAAKYLQEFFHVPAYLASVHTGAVVVPSSLFGLVTGALVMRRLRPRIDQILAGLSIVITITVFTTIALMLLDCPGNRMAGLTATYSGQPWPWDFGPARLKKPNLTAPCNSQCIPFKPVTPREVTVDHHRGSCSYTEFNPVCWKQMQPETETDASTFDSSTSVQQMTFFNPCFAGCQSHIIETAAYRWKPSKIVYTDCRCVSATSLNPFGDLISSTEEQHGPAFSGKVTSGRCSTTCTQYEVFLAIMFLHILLTGMLQNPSNVITLSCVAPEDKSVALGLQIFFGRALASFPAPIYFGQLFDLSCQYRAVPVSGLSAYSNANTGPANCNQTQAINPPSSSYSSVEGACLHYNMDGLPVIWLGAVLALKCISLLTATVTWGVSMHLVSSSGSSISTSSESNRNNTDENESGTPVSPHRTISVPEQATEDQTHACNSDDISDHFQSLPTLSYPTSNRQINKDTLSSNHPDGTVCA